MIDGVTVVVPTIPPRVEKLRRALDTINAQTLKPVEIICPPDTERLGAGATRNKGLFASKTKWTAFLDDDDEMFPDHLEKLYKLAEESDADLVFPWFETDTGINPLSKPTHDFSDEDRTYIIKEGNFIPVTYLVRTSLAVQVGGFPEHEYEDWSFLQKLLNNGARFKYLDEITWRWNISGGNTSGLPENW